MGDRCYLEITFRKEDKKKVIEYLGEFEDEVDHDNNTVTGIMYEANYGLYEDRGTLARAGIAFYGMHGSGGDYPEAVFASYSGEYVDTHSIDGYPVARVHEEGINREEVAEAESYHKIMKKVQTYFSMKPGIYAAKIKEP